MQWTHKLIVVALGVFLVLGLSYTPANAAGCCEDQSVQNTAGTGDTGAGPIPGPCTTETNSAMCFRWDYQQQFDTASTCPGDPDGTGPLPGTGACNPTPTEALEDPTVPALSGWGVMLFLLLATGGFLVYRRRSKAPGV
jgi:hypothetical protein